MNPEVGKLITDPSAQARDAIHVAMIPICAGQDLKPGQHVGVTSQGIRAIVSTEPVGIVDPLLPRIVKAGEWFWLWLYPQTVTSLRHEWEHPAFPTNPRSGYNAHAYQWIQDYASRLGVDGDELIAAAHRYIDTEDYWNQGSTLEGEYVSDQFWDQFAVLTGRLGEGNFFTCSC